MDYKEEIALREEGRTICDNASIAIDGVARVLKIIELLKDDDEVAHSLEDDLRSVVLKTLAIDSPLAALVLKSSDINFSRWYA